MLSFHAAHHPQVNSHGLHDNVCVNTVGKFSVERKIRSCAWTASATTQERCQFQNVFDNCPTLCHPSCSCENMTGKFDLKGLKANFRCKHAGNANPTLKKKLCSIKKVADKCPKTCKDKKCKKKPCKKDKKRVIHTTVPTLTVTCLENVANWYHNNDYCDIPQFRANCPLRCKRCPVSPSLEPSEKPPLSE